MAKPFYKSLSRVALMTAAALWAGCNDDAGKFEKSQTAESAATAVTEAASVEHAEMTAAASRPLTDSAASHSAEKDSAKSDFDKFRDTLSHALDSSGAFQEIRKFVNSLPKNRLEKKFNEPSKTFLGGMLGSDFGNQYRSVDTNNLVIPVKKGNIKVPSVSDLKISPKSSLDRESIMKVVRQRSLGLRHIYNKFLKKKSDFEGKIVIKMEASSTCVEAFRQPC